MSTTYEIFRFSKPEQKDIIDIKHFSEYENYEVKRDEYDGSHAFIRLFRLDNPYVANLAHSRFALPMNLPHTETNYEEMFRVMGFSEEAIRDGRIRLTYGNGWHYIYTCDGEKRKIGTEEMHKYDYQVSTDCFAIKMESLWDSSEVYAYPDHDRVRKYIPDIDKYYYAPVSNSILAKAEIPFLVFERNKGKCFIEKD